MSKVLALYVFCIMFVAVFGKHLHPRHTIQVDREADDAIVADEDGTPIEIIRVIKPSRLVPVNSALFFKMYRPCEEGFERDVKGVCREVWD